MQEFQPVELLFLMLLSVTSHTTFPELMMQKYIALMDFNNFPLTEEQYTKEIKKYKEEKNWNLVVNDPPILIFKRKMN